MARLLRRLAVLTAACAVLGACGGGGGGGSGGGPPTSTSGGGGAADAPPPAAAPVPPANAFLPTDTRIEISYGGQPAPAVFEATTQQSGTAIAPFRYPIGGKEYYVSTPESVAFAGFFAPVVVVSGAGTFTADARFNPITLFNESSQEQQYVVVSGAGTVTIAPTYGAQPLTYSGRVGYLGTEPVTTPIGTLVSKRVRLEIVVQSTIQGSTFSVPYLVDIWFARGIGIVQRSEAGQLLRLADVRGPDGDADGVFDGVDVFPADPSESRDFDGDGSGDNRDTDDDGDAVADAVDRFPRDAVEWSDFDNDAMGDNADADDDNDGLLDVADPVPRDIHNTDTDGDGTADFYDADDDNDTIGDTTDRFPLDATEWLDSDDDATGDNADVDDDNDGAIDPLDAYPFDPVRTELLSVDRTAIPLSATLGAGGPGSSFNVQGDRIAWQAESSASWLAIDTGQGTGDALVGIEVDIQTLGVGTHGAQITIRDLGDARAVTIDVTVTVSLPVLSATTDHLTFDGIFGWSNLTRTIDVSLNTGLNEYPVTVASAFPMTDAIVTTFDDGVADAAPHRINVTLDPAKLSGGRHTGSLTLSANVLGHTITRTIAIEATASQRILHPSVDGVAFTRMGTLPVVESFLARTISVLDSYAVAGTPWTASSSQPWLSVTTSGVSDGALTLTADPTGLAAGLHWATVSISSSDGNVEATRPVSVSLWLQTERPNFYDDLPRVYRQLASDPIRPYLYAHDGSSTIDVYNVHTRAAMPSIPSLGGTLGPMVTSSDGRWLFVLDTANGGVTRIDLADPSARTVWPLLERKPAGQPRTLVYARPNGHPVLLLSDARVVDAATGAVFPAGPLTGVPPFDVARVSPHGDRVCVLTTEQSPFSGACFKLLYGDLGTPDVTRSPVIDFSGFSVAGAGFAKDLAFTPDGAYAILALESNPRPLVLFNVLGGYSGPLISDDPTGAIYSARAVATAADGAIFADIINGADGTERILALNADRSMRTNIQFSSGGTTGLYGQFVTSGDANGTAFLTGAFPPLPAASSTLHFLRAK
jgi:hypothetical protein